MKNNAIYMKKSAMYRVLFGFPLGVFICYTITIIMSLIWAQGYYSPVAPGLTEECGSEIGAVILQFFLAGILGAALDAGSLVWENDNWSILKQTVVHFLIVSLSMLPIAYFTHWMDHSFIGIASYFGIFILIYFAVWTFQYSVWRRSVKQINEKINNCK